MPNWKSYEASVRLLSAIIAAHPGLKLNYDEIGRFYGGGTKYKSVWDRMTQLTRYADALKAAVESGDDPINVELAEGTAQGSKPKAKAIAGSYQQGITGDGASATTTPAKGTPRKRGPNKGTPKGKVAVMNNGAGGSDDEEVSDFATPSKKKAVLNKVKGGRVTKAKGKGKASQSFENEEDMDDFDPDTKHIIKAEHSMSFDSNGNGYSNGNGSSFGNGYFSGESPTHNNAFRFDNSEGRVYGDEEDEENTDEI